MNLSKLNCGFVLGECGSRNPLDTEIFTPNSFFLDEEQEEKESPPYCNDSGRNRSPEGFFFLLFLPV